VINNKIPSTRGAFLLLIFLVVLSRYTTAQTAYVKHYSTKEGLPSNNCYFTLQDQKGYIWVASDAGVSRFDGKVFENFSIDDGLPDNQIIRLNEDRSGKIWFSALNGQMSYFLDGKIYNENSDKLLKLLKVNAIITSFYEDQKGNIWLGTNKNLLVKWDGKSVTRYASANSSSQFINTFVYEDNEGRIWASSNRSLHLYDGHTFKRIQQCIYPISYKTAMNLPDKTMYFLDQYGMNFKNGDTHQLTLKLNTALLTDNPGYFYAENKKSVWLTNSSGVYHIDEKGIRSHYLINVGASQAMKDQKDNMWFTTTNGIYMLPRKSNQVYVADTSHGLSNNIVKSITSDKYNRLWLGLDNGKINILNKSGYHVTAIDIPDKKKFNSIKQVGADATGTRIFFSSDYGMGMLGNGIQPPKEISYLREVNNSRFVLKNFSISKDNKLAVALSSGVVIINDPVNQFSFNSSDYKEGQNFYSSRSYRVYYDHSDNLWFSNTSGLSELAGSKLKRRYQQHNLLTKRINDIAQLPDGTVILATDGYGLLFLKDNKLVKRITRADGLSNNICKKIFIHNNDLWVITNSSLNRVFLDQQYEIESFEYTGNMLDNDVNGLYIDSDTAYFATNHGLVFFANRRANRQKEIPKVLISSVLNNKKPLSLSAPLLNLAPADNNITFYYSAIDFLNSNILYRYRLKSKDSWTETKNRRIEFSSLEPGKYNFELCAKTSNSQWSAPVNISFTLQEHFWQSPAFLFFILLVASFSFYKIAVVVTRQQKDKEKQRLLLKNKILMLEQQALQAMMNPHFVFNVMNSIQHYINTKDTSSANKILTGFARLIRKNLDICTKSFISIEEEIEYLSLYLSLEKKRFGEKFNYTITIADDIDQDETMIPSMILQPYIENAIWHGLMPKEEGGSVDVVIGHLQSGELSIEIIDDGIGIENALRDKKDRHTSKGMSLTQERINLLNQIEAYPIQITYTQNGNSGTTISIILANR
jgi:sensor histidine kinase YesM/streptogramin lyase